MKITKEDRALLDELYDKYNKGLRIKSLELTDLYNRVTGKNLTNTTCGSCLRLRLFELVNMINTTQKISKERLSEEDRDFLIWAKQLPADHYPDFDKVVKIYNKAFDLNKQETNCLSCINEMLNELYYIL